MQSANNGLYYTNNKAVQTLEECKKSWFFSPSIAKENRKICRIIRNTNFIFADGDKFNFSRSPTVPSFSNNYWLLHIVRSLMSSLQRIWIHIQEGGVKCWFASSRWLTGNFHALDIPMKSTIARSMKSWRLRDSHCKTDMRQNSTGCGIQKTTMVTILTIRNAI